MKSGQYSLEQRLIEPFRAIRSIRIKLVTLVISLLGFFTFAILWWCVKMPVFHLWMGILDFFISLTDQPWQVSLGYWPEFAKPILQLPRLTAAIPPPTALIWWSFALGSILLYLFSGTWRSALLPLRATTRFILFLLWVSLACFGLDPNQFQHSVDEWSKIYFLGAYGSFVIYTIIWICAVLWFPIRTWVKFSLSILVVVYFLIATPLLLFMCTLILHYSSLILLPLLALAFAPLIQLGWFVAFYSLALSSGTDPTKEVAFE
jgi:hypothetical protein